LRRYAPFAAQRFREQEAQYALQRERSRVELVELHVCQGRSSLMSQGNAVASRYSRVGRVGVNLPRASGCDEYGTRA
jgi:hypothetical protein